MSSNVGMRAIPSATKHQWAVENFGGVPMHGAQRKQLLRVAVLAAAKPSGKISRTSKNAADRQSLYGFVENERIDHEVIVSTLSEATAHRCRHEAFVFVPIDGSSLSITDTKKSKGTGRIGSPPGHGTGLKVMDAIAVSPDGTPLGLASVQLWSRPRRKRVRSHKCVPIQKRESYRWLQMALQVQERFSTHAPGCRPWFQVDREGDFAALWALAKERDMLVTARARCDRRLATGGKLSAHIRKQRPLGEYTLEIRARDGRKTHKARIEVRASRVRLRLGKHGPELEVFAVRAREVGRVVDRARIEWMLLTTRAVDSFETARLVINGYCARWSVEEFHRTWKSGLCDAEAIQLRSFGAIAKWATILAAVAMRAAYLAQIAREKPNAPASEAFSDAELEALISLRQPKGIEVGDPVHLAQAVRWVADLGGYVGNNRSGPPGKITIGRGLQELEIAVLAIAAYKASQSKKAPSQS